MEMSFVLKVRGCLEILNFILLEDLNYIVCSRVVFIVFVLSYSFLDILLVMFDCGIGIRIKNF